MVPDAAEKLSQEALLEVVRRAFDLEGKWPSRQWVEAVLDQDHYLDLGEIIEVIPRSLVYLSGTQESSEVILTVAGLHASGAERDTERFVEALRWCVDAQLGFRPTDPGVSEEVKLEAGQFESEWVSRGEKVSKADLAKLRSMFVTEGIYSSISGEGKAWVITMNRQRALPYRDVRTIRDYLAIKDPPSGGAATPQPNSRPSRETAAKVRSSPQARAAPSPNRTTVTGIAAERHWRRLYVELGELLDGHLSPQEVADLFYEYGVTETPDPPESVDSVRDYTIETLHNRLATTDFLRHGLPKTVLELDLAGFDVGAICGQMEILGYSLEETPKVTEAASYLPPKRLPRTPMPAFRATKASGQRIASAGLPNALQTLITELNDNLTRDNLNASALLIRKIISQAVYLAMAKRGKEGELKQANGDDLDLAAALHRCKEVCQVSGQVMARVTSAKWIGDTANHSYRAKVSVDEVERAVTGLTLFLKEVL
jgi:hypothetical protein